jgi:hypothetical protein
MSRDCGLRVSAQKESLWRTLSGSSFSGSDRCMAAVTAGSSSLRRAEFASRGRFRHLSCVRLSFTRFVGASTRLRFFVANTLVFQPPPYARRGFQVSSGRRLSVVVEFHSGCQSAFDQLRTFLYTHDSTAGIRREIVSYARVLAYTLVFTFSVSTRPSMEPRLRLISGPGRGPDEQETIHLSVARIKDKPLSGW